ncbi:MAG: YhdP family protein [Xanthomonadales bacterium]|nr:YhdP family protein [Xanthomonadales bacterium]
MKPVRTWWRRLRTLMWTALTLVTVLAAIIVGIGELLMPYSQRYQPQLEDWLSREFRQPVVVDSFTGEWKAFGPRISFEGVTLMGDGQGEGNIAIQHAALDIKPLNLLLPGRPLYSFRIIGADLSLVRTTDGRFELSGLGVSGRGGGDRGQGLSSLARVGELRLEESNLGFEDRVQGIELQLTGIRGRLQVDGQNLATELEADISDRSLSRVLGDLKATLLVTLGDDQRLADARWHVKTGELMIEEVARRLPGHALIPRSGWLNAEMWGSWQRGSPQLMEGVIDVRDSTLSNEPRLLHLDHLNARFNWRFDTRKTWRIDLSDLSIDQGGQRWQSKRVAIERNIPGNIGLWVSADFLEAEFPMQLTNRITSGYNRNWPRSMPRQARGQIREFDLVMDRRWKLYQLSGRLEGVDAWEWGEGRYPDIAGLHGTMALEGGEGEIQFNGDGVRIDWPRNFAREAVVDIPRCTMEINWADGDWALDAHHCRLLHEHFEASGRARFAKSEGKPYMDINAGFERVNIAQIDDFWPRSVISENVRKWLRTGIVEGTAVAGRYSMRGDLDDWPFRDGQGLLVATAEIQDAVLDYAPGWPVARGIDLSASFRNTGLEASGSARALAEATLDQARIRIPDLKNAVLELEYETASSLPALTGFLQQSPVLRDGNLDLEPFGFEGPALTRGRMTVPLGQAAGELKLIGELDLSGSRFTEKRSGIEIVGLSGRIDYGHEGLEGESIAGRFDDFPVTLALAADWDAERVFTAQMTGELPVHELLPESLVESEPMLGHIHGASRWALSVSVEGPDPESRESWLEMSSELAGVRIDLPMPLNKAPEETWPVTVRYPLQSPDRLMTVSIEDRLGLSFELGSELGDARRASIRLGSGFAELPAQGSLVLDGSAPALDADAWMDVIIERFGQDRPPGALNFEQAQFDSGVLHLLNREFEAVAITLNLNDGVLNGQLAGPSIDGEFNYRRSADGSHTLGAQFDRLYLPAPVGERAAIDAEPGRLPELHFYARDLRYRDVALGEARVEAYPLRNGLHIESIEADSPQFHFQARGDWISVDDGDRSDFDILITSESLGALMEMMNISSVLEGGQTVLRYDAWWPGAPPSFALAKLNGEMSISVADGRILNADPGAGRMVGLLSISALPRRLALDFRDVFASGFNFDLASGTITLENGIAHTDDLTLESTAATMAITGDSDLVNQQFNYEMAVRPGVSQTLPAIGAVIGGPGGAAAGLALQGLLKNSLGDATEAVYSITGPWSDPKVEPVAVPTANGKPEPADD